LTEPPNPEAIVQVFQNACLAELEALKPGNVHRFGDGHRMSVADFERSAAAAAPLMGQAGLSLGTRIRLAVEATAAAVGQNTNLGIILLAAPLAQAAFEREGADLKTRVASVLAGLSVEDAREAYQAIRVAGPGGLGKTPEHDIASKPRVTLLEAMRAAEARDRIAWNYANEFVDIFSLGLKWLKQGQSRFGKGTWPVTRVYLGFLAHIPDTLIERKFGAHVAAEILEEAAPIEAGLAASDTPEQMMPPLLAFDKSLKQRGLNPGTSADLTVATLFAQALQEQEKGQ
jgi:triphosphoribosyl-dephospho-CoA synthase